MDKTKAFNFNGTKARFFAALTFSALTLAACGSSDADVAPVADSQPESVFATQDSLPTPTTSTTTTSTATAPETPVATAVPVTDTAPTTATAPAPTTTTSTTTPTTTPSTTNPPVVEALVVLTPEEVEGSFLDDLVGEQTVQTAVDDPLNVRSGPGVEYEVVTQLAHESDEIYHSHSVETAGGAVWNYAFQDGELLGWVNSSFLTPTVYLENRARTADCTAGADFPSAEFLLPLWGTSSDVDFDGSSDDVVVYADANSGGGPWVSVHFASGGVATGQWDGSFDAFPAGAVAVADLTRLDSPIESAEIVLHLYQGASHGTFGVMGLNGCTLESTRTADGQPFTFAHGASAGHSTVAGCGFGAHGEVDFIVTSQNFNSGEWTQTTYELEGLTWRSFDSTRQGNLADSEPVVPTIETCGINF